MSDEVTRVFAMSSQCRNKGGSCNCSGYCRAEEELRRLKSRFEGLAVDVASRLRWLLHQPCTVKPDWERPEAPVGDYQLYVVDEGDGWQMHWYSETEDVDYIEIRGEQAWPFVEEIAYTEDWERLGVEVA